MTPRLLPANATTFNAGDNLIDAISCEVTATDLTYELRLEYPVDGEFYSAIAINKIIVAKANQVDADQAFRVYRIGRTINGVTTFYGQHISYDLSGIIVRPFKATSATDFAAKIKQNCINSCPFTFSTNISFSETVEIDVPTSARSLLGGSGDNTWQEAYGGEFKFDNYSVQLLRAAGSNRGVVFRYGVDLVDYQQEDNIGEMFTGIVPFYKDGDSAAIVGSVLNATGTFAHSRIQAVDLTEFFGSTPSVAQLNAAGRTWMTDNDVGKPQVSLTIQYAQLDQTLKLHDTVGVEFVKLGVSVNAQITKTVFDSLRERNKSIDVGDVRPSLNDNVHDATKLKKGLLPAERIKDGSVGGGKLKPKTITDKELGDNCVTVNKIVNGAVVTSKVADGAVTGNKVLDKVIKNSHLTDALYSDIVATKLLVANVITAAGGVSCSTLHVNGTQYSGQPIMLPLYTDPDRWTSVTVLAVNNNG